MAWRTACACTRPAARAGSKDPIDWVADEFLRPMRDVPYCDSSKVRRRGAPTDGTRTMRVRRHPFGPTQEKIVLFGGSLLCHEHEFVTEEKKPRSKGRPRSLLRLASLSAKQARQPRRASA